VACLTSCRCRPDVSCWKLPATANTERTLLAFALANYRLNGFKVAANTTGLADLEELLRGVRPDFVKIDARHVPQPAQMRQAIRIAADSGTRLVFTRVEQNAQREFLRAQTGVWLQGWAIGRPQVLRRSEGTRVIGVR
jgi:EAL domain-containing protein (putative c-di-GMP-specific phosphodiesterase class I)